MHRGRSPAPLLSQRLQLAAAKEHPPARSRCAETQPSSALSFALQQLFPLEQLTIPHNFIPPPLSFSPKWNITAKALRKFQTTLLTSFQLRQFPNYQTIMHRPQNHHTSNLSHQRFLPKFFYVTDNHLLMNNNSSTCLKGTKAPYPTARMGLAPRDPKSKWTDWLSVSVTRLEQLIRIPVGRN